MKDFYKIAKKEYLNYFDEIKEKLAENYKGEFISEYMHDNFSHRVLNADEMRFGCKELDYAENEWESYINAYIHEIFKDRDYKTNKATDEVLEILSDLMNERY